MSFIAKLFARRGDDRDVARPLWHRVVAISREPQWYAEAGVADTVGGRFDAITMVLSVVLLRMEADPALIEPSVRLTELFVEDMDGQLRESGVGDQVVGKHMGKLMSVLGGRLGACREALAASDEAPLLEAVKRNVTMIEGSDPARVAARLRDLARQIAILPADALLAGEIGR
ncbi:ubiquinol-cytochrome C chaperone family protein [Novosphingobium sp. ZN18A2]|uniref:ubiquinol-cytochrome C chaperone family protein n=1 Tax=Novosphingobium sp. ZN18A2 TaxID=3079861 RepID=UPI0030D185B0